MVDYNVGLCFWALIRVLWWQPAKSMRHWNSAPALLQLWYPKDGNATTTSYRQIRIWSADPHPGLHFRPVWRGSDNRFSHSCNIDMGPLPLISEMLHGNHNFSEGTHILDWKLEYHVGISFKSLLWRGYHWLQKTCDAIIRRKSFGLMQCEHWSPQILISWNGGTQPPLLEPRTLCWSLLRSLVRYEYYYLQKVCAATIRLKSLGVTQGQYCSPQTLYLQRNDTTTKFLEGRILCLSLL